MTNNTHSLRDLKAVRDNMLRVNELLARGDREGLHKMGFANSAIDLLVPYTAHQLDMNAEMIKEVRA